MGRLSGFNWNVTKVRTCLKLILAVQFATFAAIALNVAIARQIIVFIYTSFLPGFLIVRILRLNLKSKIDTILISAGLSIAFLMFVGLVVNEFFPLIGFSEPLSILPLAITIGSILLILSFVYCKRCNSESLPSLPRVGTVLRCLLMFVVPVLAILGALFTNNFILLLAALAIAILVIGTFFFRKVTPFKLYPFVILIIAVSLIFQRQFISRYLLGSDVFGEFYVFRLTSTGSLWNATISTSARELLDYNGMLSVTILPTIYSSLLNVQGECVFKVVYFLLYSLVPLCLYQTYKREFGKDTAFLSAFYFVLFPRFYGEERRQIIGELFLALMIYLILNASLKSRKKRILLGIFGAALVVSHYSISFIFVFCLLFVWLTNILIKKLTLSKKISPRRSLIDASFVALILVLNLSWYGFVCPSPARALFELASRIATSSTASFLSLEARGGRIGNFINPARAGFIDFSLTNKIDYVVNKIPYLFIIVGCISLIMKFKKRRITQEYVLMSVANISILAMVLVLPFFSTSFLATRFYHVSLLFLAPVCILGGKTFLKYITKPFTKARQHPLYLRTLCLLFIVIFLFKVGFVHEITEDPIPESMSISFTRMKTSDDPEIKASFYDAYVPEQDVYSALWLSDTAGNGSEIYADETASKHVLRAYGMRIIEWEYFLFGNRTIAPEAYVYLRYLNVHGLIREYGTLSNTTELSYRLDWTDKVYSNGDSEVYRSLQNTE